MTETDDPTQPTGPKASGELSTGKTVHAFPHPFGRYTLVERLGVGGMAEVFRATQAGPGEFSRDLVIKRLLPHHAENPRFIQMFRQEAEVVARLHHSNIVQVFELGEHDGQYFIAMEYINGLSLYQLARRAWDAGRGLPLELCLAAVGDTARGLSYASKLPGKDGRPLGVVHRDVTPENLMMNREGIAKILDFGVARLADGERTTKHGEVKGKIPFLAPEQITGRELDHRTDLYALGVTLYWLLTGRRPFRADSDLWLMEAILDEPPTPPTKLNPEIPKSIEDWILCLLAKDPDDRPSDGEELASALVVESRVPRARLGTVVAEMMDKPVAPVDDDDAEFVAAEPMAEELLASIRHVPEEVLERARRSRAQRASKVGVPRAALLALGGAVVVLLAVIGALLLRDPATHPDDRGTVTTPAPAADAGPKLAKDAGIAPGEFDFGDGGPQAAEGEGEGEGEDEDEGAPVAASTTRRMRVTAPSHIRWTTPGGRSLGRGSGSLRVPSKLRSVVAIDHKKGLKTRVPVRSRFSYKSLGTGKLKVRVYPYADVYAGSTKLGSTPLKTLTLTEGSYTLRFVAGDKKKTQRVTVRDGKTAQIRVNMKE
jgi:serine/threonine-protein kinase